jgi:hypothetical protein
MVIHMFAVLFTEAAGANALNINRVTRYNDNLSLVQYGEWAHTQVRRFIIVRHKREHCYAMYASLVLSCEMTLMHLALSSPTETAVP